MHGALGAIDADRFGRRMHDRRKHRLDAMGHRVHAGGGGEQGRQAERQFGIADGGGRHRCGETNVSLRPLSRMTTAPAKLRCRCRRLSARPPAAGSSPMNLMPRWRGAQALERTFVGHHQAHRLGEVHRRAAAQRDDAVGAGGAVGVGGFRGRASVGLAGVSVNTPAGCSPSAASRRSSRPLAFRPGIGDHERARHAQRPSAPSAIAPARRNRRCIG